MARARPAPAMKNPFILPLAYVYASLLVVFSAFELVAFETTVSFVGDLLKSGGNFILGLTIAAIGAQVFGLPFVLRMKISELARSLSAVLLLAAPLVWAGIGLLGLFMGGPALWAALLLAGALIAFIMAFLVFKSN